MDAVLVTYIGTPPPADHRNCGKDNPQRSLHASYVRTVLAVQVSTVRRQLWSWYRTSSFFAVAINLVMHPKPPHKKYIYKHKYKSQVCKPDNVQPKRKKKGNIITLSQSERRKSQKNTTGPVPVARVPISERKKEKKPLQKKRRNAIPKNYHFLRGSKDYSKPTA